MYIIVFKGFCQQYCRPSIIDLSRVYNFINWNAPVCHNDLRVWEYQIWFADILELQIQSFYSSIPSTNSSCDPTNSSTCYFRVRAVLEDGSLSSYSACLNISNYLDERKGIQILIFLAI